MVLSEVLSSPLSSSTVSGGGFTLLSSNSATTLGGRIDPVNAEALTITSATVDPSLLSLGNAVSTSFPASVVLPRFEIQVTIVTFISSNRFPVWISIDYSYLFFCASIFLNIFYFLIKNTFLLYK